MLVKEMYREQEIIHRRAIMQSCHLGPGRSWRMLPLSLFVSKTKEPGFRSKRKLVLWDLSISDSLY